MPYLTTSGRRIYFELGGCGAKVLMFSNSLGTSMEMWAPQFDALSAEFTILRYDNRGHGRSDPDGRSMSIHDLAADAVAILDETQLSKVHFIGLSLGGLVGQCLALSNPERLLSLTLCATSAHFSPADMWEQRALKVLGEGIGPFVDASRERWFTPEFRRDSPDLVEETIAQLRHVDPASYAACCRVLRDADFRSRIGATRLPLQLIAGECDASTPPSALAVLHELVHGSSMTTVKQAAHILNVEQPQAVTDLIRAFVCIH